MATASLWVSVFDVVIYRKTIKWYQYFAGALAVMAVYIIYASDFEYGLGLTFGIVGSIFAAMLMILSSRWSKTENIKVITFYQMAGGSLGVLVAIPLFYYISLSGKFTLQFIPSWSDAVLILILVVVFSILAYIMLLNVMQSKAITPFIVTLVNNFTPIYGFGVAYFITSERHSMTNYFILGSMLLFLAVIIYHVFQHFEDKGIKGGTPPAAAS
jgi:drug/metabolite transporter (DMT)-like permease